jgi:dTMP kinase
MNLEKFRNKLVVFEGADLTGKTTVAQLLVKKLNENNVSTIFTFQPGDNTYGVHASIIRSFTKDKRWDLHPLANMYAFFLDKVEQVTKIVKPALDEGKAVISDRWWHSTTAYQFFGKEIMEKYKLTPEVADWLNSTSELGVTVDVVFYFPEKIKETNGVRISDQGCSDLFETSGDSFMKRVRLAYELMASNPLLKFKRVPLGTSAEETLEYLLDIDF